MANGMRLLSYRQLSYPWLGIECSKTRRSLKGGSLEGSRQRGLTGFMASHLLPSCLRVLNYPWPPFPMCAIRQIGHASPFRGVLCSSLPSAVANPVFPLARNTHGGWEVPGGSGCINLGSDPDVALFLVPIRPSQRKLFHSLEPVKWWRAQTLGPRC
ncbi:uncharacterized protein BO97DRAFT_173615 [Aspergillus homomorphus CBS 101889]|uniref:Uncharacterized protein n=1 Tax=Aspergillus homomorphus (strain CBS 101889) TaxID=1450537 RepID=A0A395IC22_ASPHC|nr:hypothetical protein BO97DRAFT_173615 [Aspergillus homomorphus CBS 101889]RAL15714.1 hypothetical protein BO97DRAFT_173615 [Aspergillus homomorphus CBS 101889]